MDEKSQKLSLIPEAASQNTLALLFVAVVVANFQA
jgi:hypothetical protein